LLAEVAVSRLVRLELIGFMPVESEVEMFSHEGVVLVIGIPDDVYRRITKAGNVTLVVVHSSHLCCKCRSTSSSVVDL